MLERNDLNPQQLARVEYLLQLNTKLKKTMEDEQSQGGRDVVERMAVESMNDLLKKVDNVRTISKLYGAGSVYFTAALAELFQNIEDYIKKEKYKNLSNFKDGVDGVEGKGDIIEFVKIGDRDEVVKREQSFREILDNLIKKIIPTEIVKNANETDCQFQIRVNYNKVIRQRFDTLNRIMHFSASRSEYVLADKNKRPYIALKNNIRKAMSSKLEHWVVMIDIPGVTKENVIQVLDQIKTIEDIFDKYDKIENPVIENIRDEINIEANKIIGDGLKHAILEQNQPTLIEKEPLFEKIFMLSVTHPRLHKALVVGAVTLAVFALVASITIAISIAIYGAPAALALITAFGVNVSLGYLAGSPFAFATGLTAMLAGVAAPIAKTFDLLTNYSNDLIISKIIDNKRKNPIKENNISKSENNSQPSIQPVDIVSAPKPEDVTVEKAAASVKDLKTSPVESNSNHHSVAQFFGSLFSCCGKSKVKDKGPTPIIQVRPS